jgi:hypothetical protein
LRFFHGIAIDSQLLDQSLNITQANKKKQTPLNNIQHSPYAKLKESFTKRAFVFSKTSPVFCAGEVWEGQRPPWGLLFPDKARSNSDLHHPPWRRKVGELAERLGDRQC